MSLNLDLSSRAISSIDSELLIRQAHLHRFFTILNFELSTVVLYLLQYFWQITIFLAALAAVLFTPYMIFVLIKERKIGWIIFFIIIVLLPLIIIVSFLSDHLFYLAYLLIPLPLFYFYCFILRFDAKEWVTEINWKITYETKKSEIKPDNDFITLR